MLLGAALLTTQGFAAPEVGRVYARALALSRELGGSPRLFPILFGLTLFYATQGQIETAREIEMQLQDLAQRHPDLLHCAEVHFVSGLLLFTRGELASAHVSFERSLALYEPQQAPAHILMYGQNPGVAAGVLSAFNCWLGGYPDQALAQAQTVLLLARENAHPYSLALALFWVAQLYRVLGKVRSVQTYTEELVLFAQAQGIANGRPYGLVLHGWVLAEQGQLEEGLARMHAGLAEVQTLGIETGKDHCLAWLAEAYSKAGQFAEGLQAVAEAQNVVGKTGERWYEAELYRLKGELMLNAERGMQNDERPTKAEQPETTPIHRSEEAEACFLHAIDIARTQQAKSWELRATLSLARLWQQQGKSHAAHSVLSDIYTWFTEGFDTQDLQEAKALLEELPDERQKQNRRQDTTA